MLELLYGDVGGTYRPVYQDGISVKAYNDLEMLYLDICIRQRIPGFPPFYGSAAALAVETSISTFRPDSTNKLIACAISPTSLLSFRRKMRKSCSLTLFFFRTSRVRHSSIPLPERTAPKRRPNQIGIPFVPIPLPVPLSLFLWTRMPGKCCYWPCWNAGPAARCISS